MDRPEWRGAVARAPSPDLWVVAAHVVLVCLLFGGSLFLGQLPYFRDLSSQYLPDYVFLERALGDGVWPLWNPYVDGGAPFLAAYLPDLLLVGVLGARAALRLGPPLHVFLAAWGASRLARERGAGPWAQWLAGAGYAASGVVLSSVSLLQLLQAAAWAPWVLAAVLRLARGDDRRSGWSVVSLAVLCALQISTLAVEIVLQTAVAALLLFPWNATTRRSLPPLAGSAGLALLLSAPAWMGVMALLEGSRRAQGFPSSEAFAWSASPLVLLEAVVPRFFGSVHTFSDLGFWGQPYYSGGFPYLPSLYVGLGVLILAVQASLKDRAWWMAVVGVAMAAGEHGPLAWLWSHVSLLRTPVKWFWLASLALPLLAAAGLDRARHAPLRARAAGGVLGSLALLAVSAVLAGNPSAVAARIADARVASVALGIWPSSFAAAGALGLLVSLLVARGGALSRLGALAAGAELLVVTAWLNPTVPPSFYDLSPPVAALLDGAMRAPTAPPHGRVFSFGVANSPPLRWAPDVARANSDVWLYYADRQTLWGRTSTLDGLPSAFGEDRTGWAPEGATLNPDEASPRRFASLAPRLRLGGVRWAFSFHDLGDEATERGRAALGFVAEPLRLYELRDALPRAFWVPEHEVVADRSALRARVEAGRFDPRARVLLEHDPGAPPSRPGAGGSDPPPEVRYEARGPHEVHINARTPPGFIVVLDGHNTGWRAEQNGVAVPVWRADYRYLALATGGGESALVLRYRPRWTGPALALAAAGLAGCLVLGRRSRAGDA
jgi:hypothetical protein